MVRLRKDLTDLGYHFTVLLNEETLYSNLSDREWTQVEKLIGPVPEQASSITVGNDSISVIKFTNSIRYRNKEGSNIQIRIKRKPDRVFWSIQDDGPGVAEEDLKKIFESFCHLDEARSHCSEGRGLGLAIVKRIVLDHQGVIYARSREGLEICMEFPAVTPD